MGRLRRAGLGLLAFIGFSGLLGKANANGFSIEEIRADMAAKNKYVYANGVVAEKSPVVQGSVKVLGKGLYGGVWQNFKVGEGRVTEVDGMFGYSRAVKGLQLGVDYFYYDLLGQGESHDHNNIQDIWITVSRDFNARRAGKISPRVAAAQNLSGGGYEHDKGRFFIGGLGYNGNILRVPFSLDTSVQYMNRNYADDSGFSIVNLQAGIPFTYKGWEITPRVTKQLGLRSDYPSTWIFEADVGRSFKLNKKVLN